jgi:hypothetical protein
MEGLIKRINDIIEVCWESFSAKIGCGLIVINKEASMQLNFAYLLKNTIDLAIHHEDEKITIELETTIKVLNRTRECDIVIKIEKGDTILFLPIEMKCYNFLASSGNERGALDIFCKDVYADLELLESYSTVNNYLTGIQLTMTNYSHVVFPIHRGKFPKYRDYNIIEGTKIDNGIHLTTPIGGKNINIKLSGTYIFNWKHIGVYYFLKLENNG